MKFVSQNTPSVPATRPLTWKDLKVGDVYVNKEDFEGKYHSQVRHIVVMKNEGYRWQNKEFANKIFCLTNGCFHEFNDKQIEEMEPYYKIEGYFQETNIIKEIAA